jgi:SAM-dependent methyltransferase
MTGPVNAFANKVPMKRSLQEQGSEHYSHRGERDLEEFVEGRFVAEKAEALRTRELIKLIPQEVTSVLDVGAGYGVFLDELRKARDLDVEGVDISDGNLEWGRARGLRLRVASAHELPYGERAFELVVCCEVLEHLQWGVFEAALKELPRVAKTWLLVSVPFDERRNLVTCPYCGAKANPNYHHRSFKIDDMHELFPDFELQSVHPIGAVSVLTMLKPYARAPWPAQLICPACFYRDERPETLSRDSKFGKLKSVLRALPFPRRPRWLSALYRRR